MRSRSLPGPAAAHDRELWQNLALAALGMLAALGAVLWVTGGISAVVTGGRWPDAGMEDMAVAARRLLGDPSNPAAAWPRRVRAEMPGPIPFYAVLVTLCAGGATTALALRRRLRADAASREATWASTRDLRPLIVKAPTPKRLILGHVGTSLVAAEARQSVIVLGPTQSMKTSGFAIPSILEWQGPVIATSVKTDLIQATIQHRATQGRTWIYDPTESTALETSSWTPLTLCADWRGAQRVAAWLASAANHGGSGLEQGEFWYTSAAKLLAPLLYAAATSGATVSDVVRWVNTQEEREVTAALKAAGTPEALVAGQASWRREPRQKSSVYTTAETILIAYEDPAVARSAIGCDFTSGDLFDGGNHTLYVAAPSHEQKRLRPLFQTLLESVINRAYELSSRRGDALDPPLLIVLDEAANIAPLPELDTLASTASAHGIQLVSIFHDLSQIVDRYGERAATVVNNHRGKIILSGVSDTQTLEYVSRLLGDEEVIQAAVTRGATGDKSTTSSTTLRSLAPASVLRAILPGEGILVYGHLLPARLRLRPWFARRRRRFLEREG
jgi:type IV secretion system protein VirD4